MKHNLSKMAAAASIIVTAATMLATPVLGQTTTLTCTPVTSVVAPNQGVSFLISGGNGTYSFSGGGVTATTTTSNVFSASFPTAGTNTFFVTSGGLTASCTVSVVSANAGATLCTSPGTATVGQNAVFNASGGNGTFTWTSPDLTITNPTGTSFTGAFSTPGVHTVTVTSGGTAATCAVNVLPAASTGAPLCSPATQNAIVGSQVNFAATGGNGSFVWSAPDLTIANPNGANFNATYTAAGTHTVTVTSDGRTANCTVTVLAASTPGLPNTGFAPAD